ncbi:hypothetical protein IWQ57_005912, partial [Coemansia nantahalensis]
QTWSAGDNARYMARLCGVPLLAATAAAGMLQPVVDHVISGHVLEALQQGPGPGAGAATTFVWLVVGRQVAGAVAGTVRRAVAGSGQQRRVAQRAQRAFVGGVVHAPLAFFDATSPRELEAAFRDGVDGAAADVCGLLGSWAAVYARAGLAFYRVGRAAPPLLLLLAPAAAWAERQWRRASEPALDAVGRELDRAGAALHCAADAIAGGGQTIRLAGAADHFVRRHSAASDRRDEAAAAYDRLLALGAAGRKLLGVARDALVLGALLAVRRGSGGSAELIRYQMLAQTLLASSAVL